MISPWDSCHFWIMSDVVSGGRKSYAARVDILQGGLLRAQRNLSSKACMPDLSSVVPAPYFAATMGHFDWCCFYYFVRNRVALLEALCFEMFNEDLEPKGELSKIIKPKSSIGTQGRASFLKFAFFLFSSLGCRLRIHFNHPRQCKTSAVGQSFVCQARPPVWFWQ